MTATSTPDLPAIARRLWKAIPRPPRPRPKPQQSWRTLRAGQHLELTVAWFDGAHQWRPGQRFEVQEPTSGGVKLSALLTNSRERANLSPSLEVVPWTAPDWEGTFRRVRKGRGKTGRTD